jgi:hypothetical protein
MIRPTRAVLIALAGWTLAGLAAHADQDKPQGVNDLKARTLVVKPTTKTTTTKPTTKPNSGAKETQQAPPTKEDETLRSNVQKKLDDTNTGQQQKIG